MPKHKILKKRNLKEANLQQKSPIRAVKKVKNEAEEEFMIENVPECLFNYGNVPMLKVHQDELNKNIKKREATQSPEFAKIAMDPNEEKIYMEWYNSVYLKSEKLAIEEWYKTIQYLTNPDNQKSLSEEENYKYGQYIEIFLKDAWPKYIQIAFEE